MKKIILTLTLLLSQLFCGEIEVAAKIIDKISHSLVKKEKINIYTNDIRSLYSTKISEHLNHTKNCGEADIIFTKTEELPSCDKEILVFATTYLAFKNLPNAVGAFFYQKGRPSIVFRKDNLEKYSIVLPKEFNKYIE